MVMIDMEKPLSCEECRFCEYEQGYCTALPVGEWRQITDMSACPLSERKTGRWQEHIGFYICTNCHTRTPSACIHYLCGLPNYCPHCGAEMEADE